MEVRHSGGLLTSFNQNYLAIGGGRAHFKAVTAPQPV
jgi:hypothetical protein